MGESWTRSVREEILLIDSAVAEVFQRLLWQTCRVAKVDCGGKERIRACITLSGAPAGRCCVELPVSAGDQVADALLGTEGDWDDELIEDAVGELCNMITGGVKGRLAPYGMCGISLPEVTRVSGEVVLPRTGSLMPRMWEAAAPGPHAARRLYWIAECCTLAVTLELSDAA